MPVQRVSQIFKTWPVCVACFLGYPFAAMAQKTPQPQHAPLPSSGGGHVDGEALSAIRIWTRGTGTFAPEPGPAPVNPVRVDLSRAPAIERSQIDAQYGRVYRYQGVKVADLIAGYKPAVYLNQALLHFANGMVVPLDFRDAKVMRKLDPLVATAIALPGKRFSPNFPPVRKEPDAYLDVRPIVFTGNKLVVSEKWHPEVPDKLTKFTPWHHVDTFVGIELVNRVAYEKQFAYRSKNKTKDKALDEGHAHFQSSCQFCHGVRKVGAHYGWDFVEPVPAFEWRAKGKNFFFHINYPRTDAKEAGLMMPALRSISQSEADKLWDWLKEAASRPVGPYEPPSH